MKTKITILALMALCLNGCAFVPDYEADEAHRTMSVPLVFKDEVHVMGIKKSTEADGTVRYRADDLSHGTTILSFERNATYKGVKLKSKPEKKENP